MIFKVMLRPILVDFIRTMDQGCFNLFTAGKKISAAHPF
jgi:hypothetical protein